MPFAKNKLFSPPSLLRDIWSLLSHLTQYRRQQLGLLFLLLTLTSTSEVISLGLTLPFLGALNDAKGLLSEPQLAPLFVTLNINSTEALVTKVSLLFIAAIILANSLRILTIQVQTHLAASIASDMSCQVYERTLLQPYQFHLRHNSSDLIQSTIDDTRTLTSHIVIPLLGIVSNTFIACFLIGILFFINGQITVITVITLGLAYSILYRLRRKLLQRNSHIVVQTSQQQIKTVQEGLGGIRDVLLAGNQDFFQSLYEQADSPYRHALASNTAIAQTPRYIIEALLMITVAGFALFSGNQGEFSQLLPVLGSLALGANRLLPILQQTFAGLVKIQGARASLKRILIGLERPVRPLQSITSKTGLELRRELRLKHIWFRYSDTEPWVIKDLDIAIKAQTIVGFVGSTGSGKSTIADIILGLLSPQQGEISIDEQPLVGEHLRQWQQSIAHVPQNIYLTDATIAENIAFGVSPNKIDTISLERAAGLAKIDDFIRSLPAGYDTYVGERGVRLSGGQRQRIGIARALYHHASVIVFDEATSALDNATERDVMAAILGLRRQVTMILIAHRLTTVERCDHIFELSQGRVVAQGRYTDLLKSSASFRAMVGKS
ncbi:MAG: ABC transporter ATP-binding protein [Leptolyngbya sp. SIOISBB]|nr:ABC transporter ATP-binding protein [Leptolyngbya sp. SIOISBB]